MYTEYNSQAALFQCRRFIVPQKCSEFEVDAKEAKLDKVGSGPCHFEVLERVSTLNSSNLTIQPSNKSLRLPSTYLLSVL
jgi:hypothetical protein